jgi:hypothetical protein
VNVVATDVISFLMFRLDKNWQPINYNCLDFDFRIITASQFKRIRDKAINSAKYIYKIKFEIEPKNPIILPI